MSYILEALKKAEKERGPAPKTDAPPPFGVHVRHTRKTPSSFLLIAAAACIVAGLIVWAAPWKSQGRSSLIREGVRPQSAKRETPAAAHRERHGGFPGSTREASIHDAGVAPQPLNAPSTSSVSPGGPASPFPSERSLASQKARVLHELPPSVQSSLPEITISAHYYDSDPPSRVATVNGRVVHEGQTVSPGLTIERITPSGVVFGFEGYLFRKEVF